MDVAHGKNYYVFPIYPMLFAGGAVVIERSVARNPCRLMDNEAHRGRRRRHLARRRFPPSRW